jgi:hypothetical protein
VDRKEKSKSADKGKVDIFERHPPFKTLILGINPQLRRAQRKEVLGLN